MAVIYQVSLSSGIPSSGTGQVATINEFLSTPGTPNSTSVITVQYSTTLNSSANPVVVSPSSQLTISASITGGTITSLTSGTVAVSGGNVFTAAGTPSSQVLTVQYSTTLNSSNNPVVVGLVSTSAGVTALGQTTMANSLPVTMASNQSAIPTTVSSGTVTLSSAPSVSVTAITQLHSTGASNGYYVAPFTLLSTTELTSAVGSSGTILSASGGSSGYFSQTNFGSAKYGFVWLTAGSSMVPTAGGNISGWFVHSPNGGTTYEKSTSYGSAPLPRAPDFIIPFSTASALAAGDVVYGNGPINLPWDTVRVFVQNNSGVALSSAGCSITCGPVADVG